MSNPGPFPHDKRKPLFALLIPVVVFVAGALVMVLWNAILPDLMGFKSISYWQATGLFILCKILFGFGFRGNPGQHRKKMKERFQNLSEEDRQRLKEEWKRRFGR